MDFAVAPNRAVDSASLKEIMASIRDHLVSHPYLRLFLSLQSATYEGTRKGKGKRVLDTSLPEVNGENEGSS